VSIELILLLPLLLLCTACASSTNTVHGRAQVMTWNDVRVVALCDTKKRYELGVFVSTAAPYDADVRAWVEEDPTPVIVEITGFPSALPSGWKPAPGVAGVLSVGGIKPVARGTCI
jgi:hypothetical protein